MKLHKKVLMLGAGGAILLGAAVCFIALMSVGFDFRRFDTMPEYPYEQRSYSADAADILEIDVDTGFTKIKVIPTQGDQVEIAYLENEQETHTITNEGGVLRMRFVSHRKVLDNLDRFVLFGINYGSGYQDVERAITLQIPQGYSESLTLKTSNSPIFMSDFPDLKRISLDTSFGEVDVRRVATSGDARLKTSHGRLSFSGLAVGGALDAQTSFGRLSAEDVTVRGNADLETEHESATLANVDVAGDLRVTSAFGKIIAEGVKCAAGTMRTNNEGVDLRNVQAAGNLDVETTFGGIRAESVRGDRQVSLSATHGKLDISTLAAGGGFACENSFGDVEFEGLEADSIRITNNNGNIFGEIMGSMRAYNIISEATNGENNLPKKLTGGEKALEATTSFGNIEIGFSEDAEN